LFTLNFRFLLESGLGELTTPLGGASIALLALSGKKFAGN
jgi:hypothetical protein